MKKNKYGRPVFLRGRCISGKVEFNKKWAEKEAYLASARSKEDIQAYKCPHCTKWHIGHVYGSPRKHRRVR